MKTQDFLGNEWQFDCMGCAISNQRMSVRGEMIARTPSFCVHQDPLIPIPVFLVIAFTRHYRSLSEMKEVEYEEFSRLIKTTHQAIKDVLNTKHLTVVQEEHSIHFHLWFFPWTEAVIECYGKPSLTKIRQIMLDYRKETISQEAWIELKKSIEQIRTQLKRI